MPHPPHDIYSYIFTDLYTNRHTQWFYFSASNTRKGQTYKINIINLMKPDSYYNHGMQPSVYSERLAAEKGIGWHRQGTHINYYRNR